MGMIQIDMSKDDLISRVEAIAWFFRPYSNEESYSNLDVEKALKAIPAVDAVPVVHGTWETYDDCGITRCSVCKWNFEGYINYKYCPMCGAKMED